MTEAYKRCIHCKIIYIYQASGHCSNKFNHHQYCSNCYETVISSLQKIPVKREKVFESTNLINFSMIEKWNKENDEASSPPGHFKIPGLRRVGIGLVDLKTGEWQHVFYISGKDEFLGKEFMYSYWGNKTENVEISVAMEKDLESDKIIGYWRNI